MLLVLFSQKRREWVIDLFLSAQVNKSEILLLFLVAVKTVINKSKIIWWQKKNLLDQLLITPKKEIK